jgi:osmotically-inducible protein OsmY
MKSDDDLKKDVVAELAWDPAVNAAAIGVSVSKGIVTVSGHLDTYSEKLAVERALRRVEGVKAIAIEIDIKLSAEHKRSDTEIAAAAESALKWQSMGLADRLRITVEHGRVRLEGEVEWQFQRTNAEKVIRPLIGVVDISNEVTLKAKPIPDDLNRRIEDALRRQALREAHRVEVSIDGSTVRLRGKVHSLQEREAVQGAVWSAPGVRTVINDIHVGA